MNKIIWLALLMVTTTHAAVNIADTLYTLYKTTALGVDRLTAATAAKGQAGNFCADQDKFAEHQKITYKKVNAFEYYATLYFYCR